VGGVPPPTWPGAAAGSASAQAATSAAMTPQGALRAVIGYVSTSMSAYEVS
jgi:hypothetical protein